jgi:hypothetical protein
MTTKSTLSWDKCRLHQSWISSACMWKLLLIYEPPFQTHLMHAKLIKCTQTQCLLDRVIWLINPTLGRVTTDKDMICLLVEVHCSEVKRSIFKLGWWPSRWSIIVRNALLCSTLGRHLWSVISTMYSQSTLDGSHLTLFIHSVVVNQKFLVQDPHMSHGENLKQMKH